MLITLLSYFDQKNQEFDNGETYDSYSDTSPTGSFTGDTMSREGAHYYRDDEEDWEQIRHPVIPLSAEEDYEIVIPPSNFHDTSAANPSTAGNTGILQRIKEWRRQQAIQRNQLGPSINTTFAELSKEDPEQMERDNIQRAMELSMLDVALVHYSHQHDQHRINNSQQAQKKLPHEILGVSKNAKTTEIKAAYRKLARLHHPDKGGEAHRFEEIARAYRSLLSSSIVHTSPNEASGEQMLLVGHDHSANYEETKKVMPLTTATCDKELQDHRRLVNDLFQADGMDLEACVAKQLTALSILGLTFKDAGATNRNERNEIIRNSCFYLSLATSYLWGIGALSFYGHEENTSACDDWNNNINGDFNSNYADTREEDQLLTGDTALQLKRAIEAAVVKAHPEWVLQGMVGEEVQAFSDFLVYTLDSHTQLSELAVVVFDATSGFCDIYKGRNYESRKASMQANTITLRYIPGHYQPLIPCNSFACRPALKDIINILDDLRVFYVITDGNS
mmetsp:Transcript_26831/g.62713  ORF Transcript_26831/g.62713 Transcript_26831/m.62713 type:complete len:506 (+) Transcript_26831:344-1861(+)